MALYDKITSSFWFCLGIFVAIRAFAIGIGSVSNPGPGFIFLLGGICLCFFSLIVFFNALNKKARNNEKLILWQGIRWKKITLLIFFLLVFTYFFEVIGFVVSVLFLMIYLFKGIEYQKWSIAIIGAILSSLIGYIVFIILLKCQLPKGILSF